MRIYHSYFKLVHFLASDTAIVYSLLYFLSQLKCFAISAQYVAAFISQVFVHSVLDRYEIFTGMKGITNEEWNLVPTITNQLNGN